MLFTQAENMKGIIAIICIATLVSTISAELAWFPGMFQLTSNPNAEDYQAFLKEMGYDESIRMSYGMAKMVRTAIAMSGNKWTATVMVDGKSQTIHYELGKPFEETLIDGRKSQSMCIHMGANMIKCVQRINGGPTVNAIEEVTQEELKMTHECKGIVARTTWRRL